MKAPFMVRAVAIFTALCLAVTLTLGATPEAGASTEDAALFFEELSSYGTWVDFDKYGPVWMPKGVESGWRPYTNGRWVPTEAGYVFETDEPWGWATYHYGNWMPTEAYGWVWVPGRTWYPNTVNWRTSDEYIGWAPIPPEGYVPPPLYAPYGGVSPGASLLDLLTAPFYVFVKAASFLLGFGSPYSSSYSYLLSGAMAPVAYIPVIYPQTYVVTNYVFPSYYPAAVLASGVGAYAWGPPIPYVSRVTKINQTIINNYIREVEIVKVRNVIPPAPVLAKRAYLKHTVPPAVMAGGPFPKLKPVHHGDRPPAGLAQGHLLRRVTDAPPLPAVLPKAAEVKGGRGHGLAGTDLPPRATHPLDEGMRAKIKALPPDRQIAPVDTPRSWSAPGKATAGSETPSLGRGRQRGPHDISLPQSPETGKRREFTTSAPRPDFPQEPKGRPELQGEPRRDQPRLQGGRERMRMPEGQGVASPEDRAALAERQRQRQAEWQRQQERQRQQRQEQRQEMEHQQRQQQLEQLRRHQERQRQQQAQERQQQLERQRQQEREQWRQRQEVQRQQQLEQLRRQQERQRQHQLDQVRQQQERQRQEQLEQVRRQQEAQHRMPMTQPAPHRPPTAPPAPAPSQPQPKPQKKKPPWEPQ